MSVVGAFPGFAAMRRRTVPAPVNPLDKSTIVSIYPKTINDKKPTIQPHSFTIPAGSVRNPSLTTVGPVSWWKDVGDDEPLLEITNSSIQVADAIIRDYCNGLLGCDMGNIMPGLFWVPGAITVKELKEKHMNLLVEAEAKQKNHFKRLVELGDALWVKSNGNPLSISEDFRLAAKELGIENKDWMRNFAAMSQSQCPACGSFIDATFPICKVCRVVINHEKAKELNLKFVQE